MFIVGKTVFGEDSFKHVLPALLKWRHGQRLDPKGRGGQIASSKGGLEGGLVGLDVD